MTADSVAPLNRIDEKLIAELETLLAAATPGPWHVEFSHDRLGGTPKWQIDGLLRDRYGVNALTSNDEATVRLIAALRNAAPLLLAEVKAQRQEIERLETWVWNAFRCTEDCFMRPEQCDRIGCDETCRCAALGTADQPKEQASFAFVNRATGEPCPRRGNVLCTITAEGDRDHRHVAAHMWPADQPAKNFPPAPDGQRWVHPADGKHRADEGDDFACGHWLLAPVAAAAADQPPKGASNDE